MAENCENRRATHSGKTALNIRKNGLTAPHGEVKNLEKPKKTAALGRVDFWLKTRPLEPSGARKGS